MALTAVKKYLKVWWRISLMAAQTQLLTNWAGVLFLIGKIVRFLLYFVFLFSIFSSVKSMAGYNQNQIIAFFLVFTLIDTLIQFIFRGIYQFRPLIVSGNFDLDLLKPLPSFFRPLFGWLDILDGLTLIPLLIYFLIFIFTRLDFSVINLFPFMILLVNSLILAFSLNLIIAGVGVITTEIDHLVMVYRDLENMARFPTDIYAKGIQFILTFTVPIVLLITVPAKALLGLLSGGWFLLTLIISLILLFGALKFWQFSLKRYSSASS